MIPSETTKEPCVVLVVEDEWLLRIDLVGALEDAGFTVVEAESAEDALGSLDTGAQADVLVTDIRLAGTMTGWDLAEAFRDIRPDGGVIYASANVALPERLVDASIFFSKPVSSREIAEQCVRLCLEQR